MAWLVVFALVLLFVSAAFPVWYYTHMFQLNAYKPHWQMKFNLRDRKWVFMAGVLALTLSIGLLVPFMGASTLACAAAASYLIFREKKVKIKLKVTMRIWRLWATFAVFNVALLVVFFLLSNIWFVIGFGVLYALIPFTLLFCNILNKPIEKSVNNHYINDARRILENSPNLKVIGITGSYGKTSTKYFLTQLLSVAYETVMTPENYNTTLGVVRTIRSSIKPTTEIFVCEMGARNVGDIKEICELVKPTYGVLTSIGPQHLETFGSIDNVIKTKFELPDSIIDGMAFLNFDNTYIANHRYEKPCITYGMENENADFRADCIRFSADGMTFTVTNAKSGESQSFTTRLLGLHNIQNITAAVAVAVHLGIPMKKLVAPIRKLTGVPHRLELRRVGNLAIIDDAYNSNLTGAMSALDCLSGFPGTRILITPGMVELGDAHYEQNNQFGAYAMGRADVAILVGKQQTEPIFAGLAEAGFEASKIYIVKSFNEGFTLAQTLAANQTAAVLIENDLPDNY